MVLGGARTLLANPLGLPIGFQSYVVRKSIKDDFAGTMKGLAAAGFQAVELCSPYGYSDFASLQQYKPQELRKMMTLACSAFPRTSAARSCSRTPTRPLRGQRTSA